MDAPDDTFSLAQLADLAGATPRTIRYYIAQGLIPAPSGGGPATRYGRAHLDRLRLIRSLQRQHLPLAEIRTRFEGLSDEEVAALLARERPTQRPAESAVDYIRGLLSPIPPAPAPAPARPPVLPRRSLTAWAHAAPSLSAPPPPDRALRESIAEYEQPARATGSSSTLPQPSRSQWERLVLGPDIELHVRRPLSRHQNRAVDRLVAFARQVLEEETS